MKIFTTLSVLAVLMILLTGCPVSSKFPLGKKGEYKLNENLLGVWVSETEDIEAKKIEITKGKETNTYNLHVIEKGSSFSADGPNFIAWITFINNESFLVLQQLVDGVSEETYFVYQFSAGKQNVSTFNISLLVKGTTAITSIDAYIEEVQLSMKRNDFLSGKIEWVKK